MTKIDFQSLHRLNGDTNSVALAKPLTIHRPVNHFIFWHVYILIAYLAMWFGPSQTKPSFLDIYVHQALGISLIYVEALYILPKWYRPRHYVRTVVIHILFFVAYSLVRFGLNQLFAMLSRQPAFSEANLGNIWLIGLYVWVLYATLGVGYYFTLDSIAKKDQILQLERQNFEVELEAAHVRAHNQSLERDKAQAELAHLRAQINPHFLFNTLNFFYETARQSSKGLAQSIMMLSEMMQYTVGRIGDHQRVPLSGELYYLKNYVTLQKQRFDDSLCIDFSVDDQLIYANYQIIPLLLITFVENAFKYGDLHDPANPLTIHARCTDETFTFVCTNKIRRSGLPEQSSGIGLNNVLERLKNEYPPEQYSLHLDKSDTFFRVNFTLNLPIYD